MHPHRSSLTVFACAVAVTLVLHATTRATPYVPPGELARMQETWSAQPGDQRYGRDLTRDELDEFDDYLIAVEYMRILDWLPTMQVQEPGENFGGMREGEQQPNVIETDNTTEAIRDWSRYARMTGDFDRFAQNIADAWTYVFRWPAYDEEGGGNPNYYRVHNCGWALIATIEYTEAYGADEDVLAYADSCAWYLDTYRLDVNGDLNAFAASFGAGALYMYGIWNGEQAWVDAGREIAQDVKTWIEAVPSRLGHHTWAMSGGTAMWGVVTALFLDDPDAGQEWLPQYVDQLPTYSGGGLWNNSWTVWNGFAWIRIHHVLEDEESLDNAQYVAGYMLDEMNLDDDGGVPATEGQFANDQSWTSAYTVWYMLEQLFETWDSPWDAAAVQFDSPAPEDEIMLAQPVTVTLTLANAGLEPLGDDTQFAQLTFSAPGSSLGPYDVAIPFGQTIEYTLPDPWLPATLGETVISATITTGDDNDDGNGTVTTEVTVQSDVTITGAVTDATDGAGVHANVDAIPLAGDDAVEAHAETDPATGGYLLYVLPGIYRVQVLPREAPYPPRRTQVATAGEPVDGVDFALPRAPSMYVINGGNPALGRRRLRELAGPGFDPCVWPVAELGFPNEQLSADPIETVFWSHNAGSGPVFSAEQFDGLNEFLETDGNRLVAGGVSLMNQITGEEALRLGVLAGATDLPRRVVASAPGDVLQGDSLFLQLPPAPPVSDAVNPFHPFATRIGYYAGTTRPAGQRVMWQEGSVSYTFGFPVESIDPGRGFFAGDAPLAELFADREPAALASGGNEKAVEIVPSRASVRAWPNPFNPALHVRVAAPRAEPAELALYDVLGRRVAAWRVDPGAVTTVTWNDPTAASGVYFLRLDAPNRTITRRVLLLR
ncbi:MAG: hypothetical protein MAG453_00645 [Calditrichaeota bacterium]|nr:hypothetical protein [Calditrichota bacterium]